MRGMLTLNLSCLVLTFQWSLSLELCRQKPPDRPSWTPRRPATWGSQTRLEPNWQAESRGRARISRSTPEPRRMSSLGFTPAHKCVLKKIRESRRGHVAVVTHYNMCRVHEALRTTPAVALGFSDRVWSIGDLLDAAFAVAPADPTTTVPDRWRRVRVDGGLRTPPLLRDSPSISTRPL